MMIQVMQPEYIAGENILRENHKLFRKCHFQMQKRFTKKERRRIVPKYEAFPTLEYVQGSVSMRRRVTPRSTTGASTWWHFALNLQQCIKTFLEHSNNL
jgi:hypothetical protein